MTVLAPSDPAASADRLASMQWRLDIVDDLRAVEAPWRALEAGGGATPYQQYSYVSAWVRHAAAGEGVAPRIGLLRDPGGTPLVVLPFGVRRGLVGHMVVYLGGSHVNLNMPLMTAAVRDLDWTKLAEPVLRTFCRSVRADGLALAYQPEAWQGRRHPFLSLPRQASTDRVMHLSIEPPFEAAFRSLLSSDARNKLRRKEKQFVTCGGEFRTARTPAEVDGMLAAYFDQKARRFAALGVDDPFVRPGVKAFMREAAIAGLGGDGLRLGALMVDGSPVAVRGVVQQGCHVSLVVQSFDAEHPLARFSAGEVLFMRLLADDVAAGVTGLDFGLGDARYKTTWSNGVTAMFDTTLAMTPLGTVDVAAQRCLRSAVRAVKNNPRLYEVYKRARATIRSKAA
jgi:CelD/BcsL family acetyltransferase involved in cellulose biosynthesis